MESAAKTSFAPAFSIAQTNWLGVHVPIIDCERAIVLPRALPFSPDQQGSAQ